MPPKTVQELYDSFEKFLIVVVHTVLHARGVYPEFAFEKVRVYDAPVYRCRHGDVIDWIHAMVASCMDLIKQNVAQKISLAIIDETTRMPFERYVFDLREFPTMAEKNLIQNLAAEHVMDWDQIHEQYSALLRVLAIESESYCSLPQDRITFTVFCETHKAGPIDPTAPWIIADASQTHQSSYRSTFEDQAQLVSRPIRFVDVGALSFNFFLEEDRAAQKRSRRAQDGSTK